VPEFAHLQVISSQWMPFVLYGLRRYFDTRRAKPLFGAGAALIAQNLSCGYFLVFFAPVVTAYVLFEVASRKLWGDFRMWTAMAVTAVGVAAVTMPFLLPYLELRRLGFPPRSLSEVESYSADVYSYLTSPAESRLWGRLIRGFPKAEGDLFPSFTALGLAAIGLAGSAWSAWKRSKGPLAASALLPFTYVMVAGCVIYAGFLILILTGRGFSQIGPLPISVRSLGRNFMVMTIALGIVLAVSPRARSFARFWLGSLAGFVSVAILFTFLMSLGPEIRTMGRTLQASAPYSFFFANVLGFDGLRVPARYGMLVMVFLSIAAGFGALEIERRVRRGGLIILLIGLFAVAESIAAPIVINGTGPEADYATPPSRMMTGDEVPPVYRYLKTLPAPGTVVAEFPFAQWTYELRYVYYATQHWHPLINGYSGTFPLSYDLRAVVLRRPEQNPEGALEELAKAGVTHVVVHENFYKDGRGQLVSNWLTSHGAKLVAEFDGDKVYTPR
jgi:hypothetical protein